MNMKKLEMYRLSLPLNYDERVEVWELGAYADKNQDLYKSRLLPIEKELRSQTKKGIFDFEKSVKLWRYWADDANKRYKAQFDYSFSTKVCQQVAIDKAHDYIFQWDDLHYCSRTGSQYAQLISK